ncbi:MAG: amidohydrolase [bacterium]
MRNHQSTLFLSLIICCCSSLTAQQSVQQLIDSCLPQLLTTYTTLHQNPELSFHEEKSSALIAKELRSLGFDVTERFGSYDDPHRISYGVVGILKNGKGPVVLLRTDMDALPIEEKTSLPYASKVQMKNDTGDDVPVMHACGHDVHMTVFIGTAKLLTTLKDRWSGTLIMIGQPAEERGSGAKALLRGGLYSKFPKPDYALALHNDAFLETGKVSFVEGYVAASVTSVDLIVRGQGGHGALPQTTKDPVVMASQIVLALQTIVSRENSPLDPAVVTVGSIHGGTKHNIIPDEVHLQLTVRAYKEEVRQKILASIKRIADGIAHATGMAQDRLPLMIVDDGEHIDATYNDPAFARRAAEAIRKVLGKENVLQAEPAMVGEDFGYYNLDHTIPSTIFWLGNADPNIVASAKAAGKQLPPLHSSGYAPVPEPTIRTGVTALSSIVLDLMKKK